MKTSPPTTAATTGTIGVELDDEAGAEFTLELTSRGALVVVAVLQIRSVVAVGPESSMSGAQILAHLCVPHVNGTKNTSKANNTNLGS